MSKLSSKIQNIMISPDESIMQAVEVLNAGHMRIVLVTDSEHRLLGIVTDSDIRIALLQKIDMQQAISTIMKRNPTVARSYQSDAEILNIMRITTLYEIPVLDDADRCVDLKLINDLLKKDLKPEHVAVIMAGGMGTRLHPLTLQTPKPLLKVGDKPILFTIIDQLLADQFTKIYITVNYKSEALIESIKGIKRYEQHIEFVEESKRLGTAGALSLIREKLKGSFLVINSDLLTTMDFNAMMRFHDQEHNHLTVALREQRYDVPYGVVEMDGMNIVDLKEKPSYSHYINAGVYILKAETLAFVPDDAFFDMTDLIRELLIEKRKVGSFPIHEYWLDIGKPQHLEQANREFATIIERLSKGDLA